MRKLFYILGLLLFPFVAYASISVPWNRISVGTESPLYPVDGILVVASSTVGNGTASGGLTVSGTATTTNLVVTSAASAGCAQFSSRGLISSTGVTCGSGSSGDPFTHTTYNGQSVSATSTGVWFTGSPLSIIASSTFFTQASTTQLTNSGNTWFTSITNKALSTDANGLLYGTATGTVTAGTGISLDNTTRQVFGGSLQITNSGVTSLTATAPLTRDSATGAVTISCPSCSTFANPFTTATTYSTLSSATTSPVWFQGNGTYGIFASSTSIFNNASTTQLTVFGNQWNPSILSKVLATDATGLMYGTATSTPTVTNGLSYSGTVGSFVGGSSGTLGLATINAGVLGAVTNGAIPTSQATSTLYGVGQGGFVLQWSNSTNGLILAATSSGSTLVGTTGQNAYFSGTNTVTGTSSLFTTPAGNIGIGTTTPGSNLSVQSGLSVGSSFGSLAPSNGLSVQGRVGVGTQAPGFKLEVVAGSNDGINLLPATLNSTVAIYVNNQTALTASTTLFDWFFGTATNNLSNGPLSTAGGGDNGQYNLGFGRNALGNLTNAKYNVAIGANTLQSATTSTGNTAIGAFAGQAVGTGGGTGGDKNTLLGAGPSNFGPTSGSNNIIIGYDSGLVSVTGNNQLNIQNIIWGTNNSGTGSTLSTGQIGIGTSSPATTLDVNGTITQLTVKSCATGLTTNALGSITGCVASDEKLKKDIVPLGTSLSTLLKLKPVTYDWKDTVNKDAQNHAGFIAQQVQTVFPQAVESAGAGTLGVDANAVNALTVKSIQELSAKVDAQQKEIELLKSQLQALTSR